MKIYTKRGDSGMTDLFGGVRVKKNHPRVLAYAEVDAANSAIGLAYSTPDLSSDLKAELLQVMAFLFTAGAEIATASKDSAQDILKRSLKNPLSDEDTKWLETSIDAMEEKLLPLKNFILPGGSDGAGRLHCARNAVRKAEVALIELVENREFVRPEIMRFFNRLSDYLFVMARLANKEANIPDVEWHG